MLDIISRHSTGKPDYPVAIGESAFWSEFKYARGTEIFAENETADYVYQIISGAVRTMKLLPDGRVRSARSICPAIFSGLKTVMPIGSRRKPSSIPRFCLLSAHEYSASFRRRASQAPGKS